MSLDLSLATTFLSTLSDGLGSEAFWIFDGTKELAKVLLSRRVVFLPVTVVSSTLPVDEVVDKALAKAEDGKHERAATTEAWNIMMVVE